MTILMILSAGFKIYGQFNENMFSLNYSLNIPGKNTDAKDSDIDINFNIPVVINKVNMLNSLNFSQYQFSLPDNLSVTDNLEQLYTISYGASFNYSFPNGYSINSNTDVLIASNLTSNINSDDLLLIGGISLKKENKNTTFELGIGYYTYLGKPQILPRVKYSERITDTFEYTAGFPYSALRYKLSERSSLTAELDFNGNYINISSPVTINNGFSVNKVAFKTSTFGLLYNYKIGPDWSIIFKAGSYIYNDYKLYDQKNNIKQHVGLLKSPYISTGIQLNIKNKILKNEK